MVEKEDLKSLYIYQGMTRGEIADELGYSQPYISRKLSDLELIQNINQFSTRSSEAKMF